MAKKSIRITWAEPPSALMPAIQDYANGIEAALLQIARDIATQAEAEMKQDAPWTDRTGDARRDLFAEAVRINVSLIRIYLSHGPDIDYGKWLELRHGGRYAIVEPTWQQYIGIVEREIKRRLKR